MEPDGRHRDVSGFVGGFVRNAWCAELQCERLQPTTDDELQPRGYGQRLVVKIVCRRQCTCMRDSV